MKNTASKAAKGWWKCNSTGIIHQWGIYGTTGDLDTNQSILMRTNLTQNFNIAFPSTCGYVGLTITNAASGDITSPLAVVHSFDRSKFIFQTREFIGTRLVIKRGAYVFFQCGK